MCEECFDSKFAAERASARHAGDPGSAMRALAAAFVVVVALPVAAQDAAESGGEENGMNEPAEAGYGGDGESAAADGGKPDGGKPTEGRTDGGDGSATSVAPESYVVQPGDTLWNLSQRFLNNPWYWPKIWSYNPDFDNPNWIRPGSQVRFYAGSAPVVGDVQDDGGDDNDADFEDVQGGGFEGDNVADRFATAGTDRRRRDFFLPTERIEDAGQVLNSPEEKRLLSITDRVYLKLKQAGKPGEVFQVFRPTRDVRHPVTGANIGKLVALIGEVRVDALSREQALGTVMNSWDTLERGDFVGRLPVEAEPSRAVANAKNVKGYVVDAGTTPLSFFGETYVVVIDKGSADGVQVGNSFTVVRAGDPYLRQYTGLADEDIGEVLIIETEKKVSTGVLVNSAREIVPGDRCEMRVAQ
jgi:hypothetical protein